MKEKICIEFEADCDGKTIIIPEMVSEKFKGKVKVVMIAETQEKRVEAVTAVKSAEREIPLERDDIYER